MRASARRRGFLSFFLGIIVGIVLVVAAVGGVGWWAYKNLNLSMVEDMAGQELVPGNPDGIKDKTVEELIKYVADLSANYDKLTLNDVKTRFGVKIEDKMAGFNLLPIMDLPLVSVIKDISGSMNLVMEGTVFGDVVDSLNLALPEMEIVDDMKKETVKGAFDVLNDLVADEQTFGVLCRKFGFELPADDKIFVTLGDITVGQLKNNPAAVKDSFMTLTIGDIYTDIAPDNLLLNSIKGFQLGELDQKVQTLQLQQIMTIDESAPPLLKTLQTKTLLELQDLGAEINDYKLNQLIDIPADNKIMQALAEEPIGNLSTAVGNLHLSQVIDIYETQTPEHAKSPQLLIALKDTPVTKLGDVVNDLTLGDVLEITPDSPLLLRNLAAKKVTGLGGDIENLTLEQVIPIDANSGKLLNSLKGRKITELDGALNSLTLDQVIDVPQDGILHALAYRKNSDGSETAVGISEIQTRIDEVTMAEMFPTETADPTNFLYYLKDIKLTEMSTGVSGVIMSMNVGDLVQVTQKIPPQEGTLLYLFRDKTFSELISLTPQDVINAMNPPVNA